MSIPALSQYKAEVLAIAHKQKMRWTECGYPNVFENGFWKLTPHTIEDVEFLEDRIERILPSDYRQFLVSVGRFPLPGFGNSGHLLGVEQVQLGSSKKVDFPGRLSRLPETRVLNNPLLVNAQHSQSLGLEEYLECLIITEDNNYGKHVGLIHFRPDSKKTPFEYILDEAWDGSLRFKSFSLFLENLIKEAMRSLSGLLD